MWLKSSAPVQFTAETAFKILLVCIICNSLCPKKHRQGKKERLSPQNLLWTWNGASSISYEHYLGRNLSLVCHLYLSRCFLKASTSGEHSTLDIVKTSTDKHTCYTLKWGGNRRRLFIQGFLELVSILNHMWQWGDIPHSFPHVQHTICQTNKSHVLAGG